LTKPFSMPELLARVRAQIRRLAEEEPDPSPLAEGDFTLDIAAHTATLSGRDLHLTPKEFELLALLLKNAGRVVTRRVLLRSIWGPSGEDQPEYLRVLIGQLRKKLDGNERQYIQSEPWVGYRLLPGGAAKE
jgi:two-component system KDP operon response regulator KdpE